MLQKAGIDFNLLYRDGIPKEEMVSALQASGLLSNESINWITFHGSYDLAYLYKMAKDAPLPDNE